jgi:hypothetical protein
MKFMLILSMISPLFLLGAIAQTGSFGGDVDFLKKHTEALVLGIGDAKIAVAPAYQGRVMTSTTGGDGGPSFGWLNYKVIEAGLLSPEARKDKLEDHIYVFGGEERIWLGPEGGQNSIFFAPGSKFEFDVWHTPAMIDTEPFALDKQTATSASFHRDFEIANYSGTKFTGRIERDVRVMDAAGIEKIFGIKSDAGVKAVAYETDNRLINKGAEPWSKDKGLLSIWLLGMYKPSPATTIVVPFKSGPDSALGPKVNDAYFGKIPADYLQVKDDVLFLKGDGTRRGKVGISPARSKGIAGSYDAAGGVLTLVKYNPPKGPADYVNSMWELQKNPYGGDVVNAYNDGSPAPGKPPLGPFFELETSSPGAALPPGGVMQHVARTIHIAGPEPVLEAIAKQALGASLKEIKSAFSPAR